MTRAVERRGAWSDRVIDALCNPPESFLLSQIVAHTLTFAAPQEDRHDPLPLQHRHHA